MGWLALTALVVAAPTSLPATATPTIILGGPTADPDICPAPGLDLLARAEREGYRKGIADGAALIIIVDYRIALAEDDVRALPDAISRLIELGAPYNRLVARYAKSRLALLRNDVAAYAESVRLAEQETHSRAADFFSDGDKWGGLAWYYARLSDAQEPMTALATLQKASTFLDRAAEAQREDKDPQVPRLLAFQRSGLDLAIVARTRDPVRAAQVIERLKALSDAPTRGLPLRSRTLFLISALQRYGEIASDDNALREAQSLAEDYRRWLAGRQSTRQDLPVSAMRAFETAGRAWRAERMGSDSACVARADIEATLAHIDIAREVIRAKYTRPDAATLYGAITRIAAARKKTSLQPIVDRNVHLDEAIALRLLASVTADRAKRALILERRVDVLDAAYAQTQRCFCANAASDIETERAKNL